MCVCVCVYACMFLCILFCSQLAPLLLDAMNLWTTNIQNSSSMQATRTTFHRWCSNYRVTLGEFMACTSIHKNWLLRRVRRMAPRASGPCDDVGCMHARMRRFCLPLLSRSCQAHSYHCKYACANFGDNSRFTHGTARIWTL